MKKTRSGVRAGDRRKNAEKPVITGENASNGDGMVYEVNGEECDAERVPEAAPAPWMSPALIEKTHAVWSKAYGRPLERSEVLEILRNVRWFGELLRRGMNGGTK